MLYFYYYIKTQRIFKNNFIILYLDTIIHGKSSGHEIDGEIINIILNKEMCQDTNGTILHDSRKVV